MKILTILISLVIASNTFAGEWTRISDDTLSFKGGIEPSDFEKFEQAFNANIKKIIVDSGGGDAETGLSIGKILAKANVDIEVQGICMSSCANYIFTAGRNKILNQGIVGFHGNMTALFRSTSKEQFIDQMKEYGSSEEQALDRYNYIINEVLPKEELFFAELKISQDLFDRTQKRDKGMGSGTYSALLPTASTFLKYGIRNVFGEQSQFIIDNDPRVLKYAEIGAPVIVD